MGCQKKAPPAAGATVKYEVLTEKDLISMRMYDGELVITASNPTSSPQEVNFSAASFSWDRAPQDQAPSPKTDMTDAAIRELGSITLAPGEQKEWRVPAVVMTLYQKPPAPLLDGIQTKVAAAQPVPGPAQSTSN